MWPLLCAVLCVTVAVPTVGKAVPEMVPDLNSVDSYELQKLGADKFFTLWHINMLSGPVELTDRPWTVFIPTNKGLLKDPSLVLNPDFTRNLLLNHVVLGEAIDPSQAANTAKLYDTLGETKLSIKKEGESFFINGIKLTGDSINLPNGIVHITEDSLLNSSPSKSTPKIEELFAQLNSGNKAAVNTVKSLSKDEETTKNSEAPAEKPPTRATRFDKFKNKLKQEAKEKDSLTDRLSKSLQESVSSLFTSLPPSLPITQSEKPEFSTPEILPTAQTASLTQKETIYDSLRQESEFEHAISREFFRHLIETKLEEILIKDGEYTLIIPTDDAFYDYYLIDYGFNPFLVESFAKDVILSHIIRGNHNLYNAVNGTMYTTLNGKDLVLTKSGENRIEVNGIPIVPELDLEVQQGRFYYIDSLLFVNDERVEVLRKEYPYLEAGPLLGFPWPKSQFLSHLVKDLELNPETSAFLNILKKSSISEKVSSRDGNENKLAYTAFIPSNLALNNLFPDGSLQNIEQQDTDAINKFLLNHIFHGYIFEKDLQSNGFIVSLSNSNIRFSNSDGRIRIGDATVVGPQNYLFNLGSYYMIDGLIKMPSSMASKTEEEIASVDDAAISVPFPAELAKNFPSALNPDYKFETRTEVSYSKQVNNGEVIPITEAELPSHLAA